MYSLIIVLHCQTASLAINLHQYYKPDGILPQDESRFNLNEYHGKKCFLFRLSHGINIHSDPRNTIFSLSMVNNCLSVYGRLSTVVSKL